MRHILKRTNENERESQHKKCCLNLNEVTGNAFIVLVVSLKTADETDDV